MFQEAQIYPVLTAGKGSKHLGWFAHHARAAKHSQGYSLPRGEANYQGGKTSAIDVFGEGFLARLMVMGVVVSDWRGP